MQRAHECFEVIALVGEIYFVYYIQVSEFGMGAFTQFISFHTCLQNLIPFSYFISFSSKELHYVWAFKRPQGACIRVECLISAPLRLPPMKKKINKSKRTFRQKSSSRDKQIMIVLTTQIQHSRRIEDPDKRAGTRGVVCQFLQSI